MKELISKQANYYIKPISAIITNNYLIPGKKGFTIDIDKSYNKMKKINYFNETLLVYKELKPLKSYKNNYDKLIISGNKYNNNLSLIFSINNIDILSKIITILDNYNISGNFLFEENYFNYIKKIDNVNILVNEPIFNNKTTYVDYCLSNNKAICFQLKLYTIKPTITINNYHFTYTKNNLQNGAIIHYKFNNQNINNLELIIKYILSNNYHIVTLNKLLEE